MKYNIYDDLYRYSGNRDWMVLCRYFLLTPGFRYIYFLRKAQNADFSIIRLFWMFFLRQTMLRTGIQIPVATKIGRGFRIVHFGSTVINPAAVIGENFNISQGVTIGSSEGKHAGVPRIGNNVSIQANAVVVGGITIGHDVLIAPNAFVNIDIPEGCIAMGNPAIVILKEKASAKYIVYKV